MNALVVEVIPRHRITRQVLDGIVRDSFGSRRERRFVSFRICHREAIQCPSLSSGPCRVSAETLMRMGENPLSRSRVILQRKFHVSGGASVQSEALRIVSRIVMYGLKYRSIGAHKPLCRP